MKIKWFEKNNIFDLVISGVFIIAFIFLFVSLKCNSIILEYICATIIFVCMAISLIHPLVSKTRTTLTGWIVAILSFALFVSTAIEVLKNIQDDKSLSIAIPLVASSITGFLTLAGVGLSIKHNYLQNYEDYIRKNKPYIYIFCNPHYGPSIEIPVIDRIIETNKGFSNIANCKNADGSYRIGWIYIGTTDFSMCSFVGIRINKIFFIKFDYEELLLKKERYEFHLSYDFILKEELKNLELILGDVIGNLYTAKVNYEIENLENNRKWILITSVLSIERDDYLKLITEDDN